MLLRFLLAAAALLTLPAAAHADSIVFVKDANVWVASPDGSNQRQLTRDGTADHPVPLAVAGRRRHGRRLVSRRRPADPA